MKKILLITALLFVGIKFSNAQNALKLGHINSAELLSLMPESKVADTELKKYGESLDAQLKAMHAEYQGKIQDYQSKETLMAEVIKQTKQREIMDLETRINDFQEQGQSDIQKKKEELYTPILKKAQDAINTIAKEQNYSYIFDMSLGSILFAQESNDIMPAAKKKLGLSTTPAIGEKEGADKKIETPKK